MANQKWNPQDYGKSADFVPALGRPVIELLAPQAGETIMDLACGDGTLTKEFADKGFDVTGVDASPEMVAAAQAKGIRAVRMEAENLTFKEAFDAVMSNAALHWMNDQYAVVRGVWNALRPGGRFACECGGEGCIRIIREGMKIALIKRGVDYKARNPWKYPQLGPFQGVLENQGFKVSYMGRQQKNGEKIKPQIQGCLHSSDSAIASG